MRRPPRRASPESCPRAGACRPCATTRRGRRFPPAGSWRGRARSSPIVRQQRFDQRRRRVAEPPRCSARSAPHRLPLAVRSRRAGRSPDRSWRSSRCRDRRREQRALPPARHANPAGPGTARRPLRGSGRGVSLRFERADLRSHARNRPISQDCEIDADASVNSTARQARIVDSRRPTRLPLELTGAERALDPHSQCSAHSPLASAAAAATRRRPDRGRRPAAAAAAAAATAAPRRSSPPKVASKDVPVDLAAIGNVEALRSRSRSASQVTGHARTICRSTKAISSSRDKLLFTLDRAAVRGGARQAEANLLRDQALLARPKRSSRATRANAEYSAADRRAPGAARPARHHLEGLAEQIARRSRRDRARRSRPTAPRSRARRRSSSRSRRRSTTRACRSATPTIKSPIDGRTGNLGVKVGSLVTANQTELMTIAQRAAGLRHVLVPAIAPPDDQAAHGGGKLPVTATPQDADAQPATGVLTFVDNAVDMTTDTIKLKATFDNHRSPAVAGPVRARQPAAHHAPARDSSCRRRRCRPARTASSSSSSSRISTVEQRPITVGQRVGDDVVVDKGLRPGETVVTEGQLRLEPGTRDPDRRRPPGRRRTPAAGRTGGQGEQGRAGGRTAGRACGEQTRVNVSEIFIRRPIATSLLMAAIALFGVVAYRALPVSDLPTVDYPDDQRPGEPAGRRSRTRWRRRSRARSSGSSRRLPASTR